MAHVKSRQENFPPGRRLKKWGSYARRVAGAWNEVIITFYIAHLGKQLTVAGGRWRRRWIIAGEIESADALVDVQGPATGLARSLLESHQRQFGPAAPGALGLASLHGTHGI